MSEEKNIEFVLEVELPDGKMKSDGKKVVATFGTEQKARDAMKLYRVTIQKQQLELRPIVIA